VNTTPSSSALGPVEQAVLRELAARRGRPCSRARLYHAVFGGQGERAAVDAAVKRLVEALGPDGHHVERLDGAWQLWDGPE
jgi:DNA-binding response OmpR family regulator